MLDNILIKIGVVLVSGLTWLASAISPVPIQAVTEQELNNIKTKIEEIQKMVVPQLGADNFKLVAGQRYYLSGSGIGISDTSISLKSLTLPVSGTEITMDDFGTIGYATLEPNTSKKELISFTGITQSTSTAVATLTGVTRGLRFNYPYTQDTAIRQTHSGNSVLIFSNSPQVYAKFSSLDNDESINGTWTFNALPIASSTSASVVTSNAQFVTKAYADNLAYGTSTYWLPSGSNIYYGGSGNIGIGTSTPSSKLHLIGDFLNTGTSTISGNATIGGTFGVTGLSSLGIVNATGLLTASGNFTSSGTSTLSGVNIFSGAMTLSNTLSQSGTSTFTGNLLAQGSANTLATTTLTGTQTFNGNISFATSSTVYTNAVLWQYLGTNSTTTSITALTGATAAIVHMEVGNNNTSAAPACKGEVTVFSAGKTTGNIRCQGVGTADYSEASVTWSGGTVSLSYTSNATPEDQVGTIYWYK